MDEIKEQNFENAIKAIYLLMMEYLRAKLIKEYAEMGVAHSIIMRIWDKESSGEIKESSQYIDKDDLIYPSKKLKNFILESWKNNPEEYK